METQFSEPYQELLDTRFCYKMTVILLLSVVTVSDIPTNYISIKLYWTVVCRKIELLGKKP